MNISIDLTKSPDGSICPSFTVTHGGDKPKPFTLTPEGAQQTAPTPTVVGETLPLRSTAGSATTETGRPGSYVNIQTLPNYSGVALPREVPPPTVSFKGLGKYTTVCGDTVEITYESPKGFCYGKVFYRLGDVIHGVKARWWQSGIFDQFSGVVEGVPPRREHLRLSVYYGAQTPVEDLTKFPGLGDKRQDSPTKPTTGYQGPGRYTTVGGHSVTIERGTTSGYCYGRFAIELPSGWHSLKATWLGKNGYFFTINGQLPDGCLPHCSELRLSVYLGAQPTVDDLTRFPGLGVYKLVDGKEAHVTRELPGMGWAGTIENSQSVVGGRRDVEAHWTRAGKFVRFSHERSDVLPPDWLRRSREGLNLLRYVGAFPEEIPVKSDGRGPVPIGGPGKYRTGEGTIVTFEPLKPGKTSPVRWGDFEYPDDATAPRRGCWEAKTGEFIRFANRSISDANARRHRLRLVEFVQRTGVDPEKVPTPPPPAQPTGGTTVEDKPVKKDPLLVPGFFKTRNGIRAYIPEEFLRNAENGMVYGFLERTQAGGTWRSNRWEIASWSLATGRFMDRPEPTMLDLVQISAAPRSTET